MRDLKGVLGMTASALFFSVMALLIRYVSHIDFFKTSLYRFAVGACILGTLALFKRIKLTFNDSRFLFLRGLFGGLSAVLLYMSIVKVGLAKGTIISYTYPFFATLGGIAFLKERVKPMVWLFLTTAIIGITFLVAFDHGQLVPVGNLDIWVLLTLLGAIIAGGAIICVKKLTTSDSYYSIALSQCLIGFWIVAVPANLAPIRIGWLGGIVLVGIGITAMLAQILMNWAFARISLAAGSLLGMLTPVLNVLFGIVLFAETMTLIEGLGAVLILSSCTGVILVNREPIRNPR